MPTRVGIGRSGHTSPDCRTENAGGGGPPRISTEGASSHLLGVDGPGLAAGRFGLRYLQKPLSEIAESKCGAARSTTVERNVLFPFPVCRSSRRALGRSSRFSSRQYEHSQFVECNRKRRRNSDIPAYDRPPIALALNRIDFGKRQALSRAG